MNEWILPKRVTPQPTPFIVDGGDCGACVLSGLSGLSVEEIYEIQKSDKPKPFYMTSAIFVLDKIKQRNLIDEYVTDTPIWLPGHTDIGMQWGLPSHKQALPWWRYIRMSIQAGYYCLVPIRLDGDGLFNYKGDETPVDHIAMIPGVRKIDCGNLYDNRQVLLNCSSTSTPDERWIDCRTMLRDFGGFNTILVRP